MHEPFFKPLLERLTDKEQEIAKRIAQGVSDKRIMEEMNIQIPGLVMHKANIRWKIIGSVIRALESRGIPVPRDFLELRKVSRLQKRGAVRKVDTVTLFNAWRLAHGKTRAIRRLVYGRFRAHWPQAVAQRKALLLDLKGYSNEEIAEIMQIQEKTAKSHLSSAKGRLLEMLPSEFHSQFSVQASAAQVATFMAHHPRINPPGYVFKEGKKEPIT